MRSLPDALKSALAAQSVSIVWFAEIADTAPAPVAAPPVRIATRPVIIEEAQYAAGLLELRSLSRANDGTSALARAALAGCIRSAAELRIAKTALGAASRLGARLRIGLAAISDPATPGNPVATTRFAWAFDGTVYEELAEGATRTLRAEDDPFRDREIAAPLSPEQLLSHGLDPARRLSPPVLLGVVQRAPLLPWNLEHESRLAADLGPDDHFLLLEDSSGFPSRGRLQIGDEVCGYAAVNRSTHAVGSSHSPLERTEARSHARGARVLLLPQEGACFLVAGHPCRSVDEVRAEETLLPQGNVQLLARPRGGDLPRVAGTDLLIVRLDRLPVAARYSDDPVTRRLEAKSLHVTIDPASTSISGGAAFDEDPATSARLYGTTRSLVARFGVPLGAPEGPGTRRGDRRLGAFAAARLRVTLAASRPWSRASNLKVRISNRGYFTQWSLQPPAQGSGTSNSATAPVPPTVHTLDFSPICRSAGGWGFFAEHGAPLPEQPRFEVTFTPVSDNTQISVVEVALEFEVHTVTSLRMIDSLSANVQGLTGESNALLERPTEILRAILTPALPGDADGGGLDEASWSAALAEDGAREWRVARRIAEPRLLREIARELLEESGRLLLNDGTRWKLATSPAWALREEADANLAAAGFAPGSALDGAHDGASALPGTRTTDGVVGSVHVLDVQDRSLHGMAAPPVRVRWRESVERAWGERTELLHTAWIRGNSGAAQGRRMASRLLARRAFGAGSRDGAAPLRAIALEPGDVTHVRTDAVDAPLRAAWCRETRVVGGGSAVSFGLLVPQQPRDIWASASGEVRLEVVGDGGAILVLIEGRVVGLLGAAGDLRIPGTMQSLAASSPEFVATAIGWNASARRFWLARPEAGGWRVVVSISPEGEWHVAGETESLRGTVAMVPSGENLGTTTDSLWLSADARRVALRLVPGEAGLQLFGDLVETHSF